MSHLHLPDGILPWWLVAAGWLGLVVAIRVAARVTGRLEQDRRLPRLGFVVAFMALAMSIEILPPAYHLDLSVLAGILLGPALGFLAGVAVVILLALVGHGGVTVIGLNGLVIGTEVALGGLTFNWLARRGMRAPAAAATATVSALATSTALTVALLVLAGLPAQVGHEAVGGRGVATVLTVVVAAGLAGWTLEAVLTALLIRYLQRVRPGLVVAA